MIGKRIVKNWLIDRGEKMIHSFESYLVPNGKILDVGAGSCTHTKILQEKEFEVTPLDIRDYSIFETIHPILYDGKKIPFESKSFDTILFLTVLHHSKNFEELLKDAKRVAHRVIIIEDIYNGRLQKYFTFIMDSIVNLEFLRHPHSNQTDEEWRKIFKTLGFELEKSSTHHFWKFFTSALYILRS